MESLNFCGDVRSVVRLNAIEKAPENTNTHLEAAPRPPSFGAEEVVAERRAVGRLAWPRDGGGFVPEPRVLRLQLVDAPPELPAPVTPVDATLSRLCHVLRRQ